MKFKIDGSLNTSSSARQISSFQNTFDATCYTVIGVQPSLHAQLFMLGYKKNDIFCPVILFWKKNVQNENTIVSKTKIKWIKKHESILTLKCTI